MRTSRLEALMREQEGLETLSREAIEAVQLEKLNRLLWRERRRQGFYAGLPERLDRLSQLSRLPFTTEEDLARHAGGMLLTSQGAVQRVLSDATSGTTGAAKRVFYTEGDCENTVRLYMAGLGELIFPGSVTMICFPFSGPYGLGELIAEAVTRLGATPLKLGASLTYGAYRAAMERADTFVGMPAQLLSLLRAWGRGSLRRALVSGDACPERVMEASEALLGSRLFPHYGSREMGMAGAITCPAHEGMHLRENHVIAEVIGPDGGVLPPGETGELVITTIGMEALPLIRYRTGDLTRLLPEPCPCGCAAVRLGPLVRRGEGARFLALENAVFACPEVVDYRAERRGDELTLTLLTRSDWNPEELRPAAEALLPGLRVTLRSRAFRGEDGFLYRGKRGFLLAGDS